MHSLRWVGSQATGYLKLIDQTKLPHKLVYVNCRTLPRIITAIKTLQVRGAPAIGVTAGFGAFIAARSIRTPDFSRFYQRYNTLTRQLVASRPTAVNLKWAVDRINQKIMANKAKPISAIKAIIFAEAMRIFREDRTTCDAIGRNGAKLIKNGMSVLTHCNTGFLATAGSGTALAVLYAAKKQGKRFSVYATETRPLLQGARLTAWELKQARIDVTLLCDNMVGSLMSSGKVVRLLERSELYSGSLKNELLPGILGCNAPLSLTADGQPTILGSKSLCSNCRSIDLVIVGADRIARNGDTANKIGTYQLALLSHYHRIPFYVVAPMSTFDFRLKNGRQIPIEFRSPAEVTHLAGKPIAPTGVKAYNPAFDVTPAKLISGWITEKGIILPQRHTSAVRPKGVTAKYTRQ